MPKDLSSSFSFPFLMHILSLVNFSLRLWSPLSYTPPPYLFKQRRNLAYDELMVQHLLILIPAIILVDVAQETLDDVFLLKHATVGEILGV